MDKIPQNIVGHQNVSDIKRTKAKELRKNMTPQESELWNRLRNNQLNSLHFRRQQIIDGFIVDFYCHSIGLANEVDGEVHNNQVEYDKRPG